MDSTKVLGQLSPAAATLSDLYAVPALTNTTASSIVICNHNNTSVTVRVAVAVGGAADDPEQYLYYDLPVSDNDTFIATIGITLGPADVVRVYASATGVSFNLFGVEVS